MPTQSLVEATESLWDFSQNPGHIPAKSRHPAIRQILTALSWSRAAPDRTSSGSKGEDTKGTDGRSACGQLVPDPTKAKTKCPFSQILLPATSQEPHWANKHPKPHETQRMRWFPCRELSCVPIDVAQCSDASLTPKHPQG